MSGLNESAKAGEQIDYDLSKIHEISYLAESVFCEEWLSAADAEAYDDLRDRIDLGQIDAVIPGLPRDPS